MSHLPGVYSGFTRVRGSKVSTVCRTRKALLRCTRKEPVLLSNGPSEASHHELELAKNELLNLVSTTSRGKDASLIERGLVAEAQASVEAFSPASIADWDLLQGTWDVVYSTAPDVVALLQPLNGLPLRVGRISQRFSPIEVGCVENIIELLIGAFAINDEPVKVQLVVQADYCVRTARSISLTFQKAGFSGISFSQTAQDLLAPALLPRGWWNLALLVGLQQLEQVQWRTR
jgi:hypothetical protein